MINRVEHLHDVALELDGVGNKDGRAFEIVQGFDKIGLAVAWFPIDKERIRGTYGRADLRDGALCYYHGLNAVGGPLWRAILQLCADGVRPQCIGYGNERWSGALVGVEIFAGAGPAGFGEVHQRGDVSDAERAFDLDVMLQD